MFLIIKTISYISVYTFGKKMIKHESVAWKHSLNSPFCCHDSRRNSTQINIHSGTGLAYQLIIYCVCKQTHWKT